ncbi:MAG: queuosine precursor transporter [Mailhella sp.]|nr:queuosine precursor transporter [Mailhella sp.]
MQNRSFSPVFLFLCVLFCTCLILSNLLASKIFMFGGVALPAAVLIFPVSYIIGDVVTEVWGFRRARLVIWLGFGMNFFVAAAGQLAAWLPPAPFWDGAEHFNYVFGLAPRIALASFAAFLTGSFVNAYVMSRMKLSSGGRHFWLRAMLSTVAGEGVDSLVFFPLAFWGMLSPGDMLPMMLAQVTAKTLYEAAVLPLTARAVQAVKSWEGTDVYDRGVSYSIWRVGELG